MKNELKNIKELLVVVDMVNGFVKSGALADPYIQHIVPEIERLVKEFQSDEEKEVVFIRDAHTLDSLEFKKFPQHCVDGEWESEIIDELKSYSEKAMVFKKNSRSTMFAPGFISMLESEKMKLLRRVIAVGCCTDLCDTDLVIPISNYFDQMNRNVEIVVPKDAVETYDAPWHNREEYNEMAYKLMEQEGIKLVKTLGGIR